MCLLIWTVFSGERCGPWASCSTFWCMPAGKFECMMPGLLIAMECAWCHLLTLNSGFFLNSTLVHLTWKLVSLSEKISEFDSLIVLMWKLKCHNVQKDQNMVKTALSYWLTSILAWWAEKKMIKLTNLYMHDVSSQPQSCDC